MTRATYNTDNTLTEFPGVQKPKKRVDQYRSGSREYYQAIKVWHLYNKQKDQRRTLVCSPECRGLWKPGDQLEEYVDYVIRDESTVSNNEDGTQTKNPSKFVAFPLPVNSEQSEDDLWYKAIDLIMVAHDKGLSKEDAVGVVKSQFIITKR